MSHFSLPGLTRQTSRLLVFNTLWSIALFGVVDVLLNFYFVSLGYTNETIGLLQSVPRIGGLVAAALVVPLTARLSGRSMLILTTLGMALAQAAIVVVPTPAAIALSRAALGLFFGLQQIAINPIAAALTGDAHQTRIFAYINMSSNVAGSLGGFIGGLMPAWIAFLLPALSVYGDLPAAQTPFAYGLAIFLASIVIALSVIPIWRLMMPEVAVTAGDRTTPVNVPWRKLLMRSVPMVFFGFTGGLTFPFFNLFFRNVFDASDATVGVVLSLGFLVMGVPVMLSPQLERRFGRSGGLLLATGLAAAAFFGLSLSSTLGVATVFFVIAISLRSVTNGIYPPMLLAGIHAQAHNAASSISFLGWNLGWLGATSIGGVLIERVGYGPLLQIVAIGVLLIGLSTWWIYRREGQPVAISATPVAALPAMPSES